MTEVHPRLFLRGHTRGVDPETVLTELQRRDVRFVLCVAKQKDPRLEACLRLIGIRYVHEPLQDGRHIPADLVRTIAKELAGHMAHYPVMVHCDGGRNRAPLIAALALMQHTNCTGEEAFARLRTCRPTSFSNVAFEQFVRAGGESSQLVLV
jgi:protein-tyrosine phosphatase